MANRQIFQLTDRVAERTDVLAIQDSAGAAEAKKDDIAGLLGLTVAADIADFDTEVANNSAVAANTAKVTNATHTGDVTGATALTIAAAAVTNAKLANVATATLKGRSAAGTGVPEDLTATQVRALLNVENGADVTDTANVTAAGALMDSEVADLTAVKTLLAPDNTTISEFGASLIDDAAAANALVTLGLTATATELNYADGVTSAIQTQLNTLAADIIQREWVSSVNGALTVDDHSGRGLITSGNVVVPTTAGFHAIIKAGGAHTVSFNGTTSAAMAAGDVMTVEVQSATVIIAVLTAAADLVTFS